MDGTTTRKANIRMAITKKLREDIKVYGINLPTNGRTKEFKKQVEKYKLKELYIAHLRDLVRDAKLKEKKIFNRKIKYYQKQVAERTKQNKIETGINKAQVLYFKNKLLFMSPTESALKSYWKYTIWNDRGYLAGLSNITEDEVRFNLIKAKNEKKIYNPPNLLVGDVEKFIEFCSVMRFLKNHLHHKVWISIDCLSVKNDKICNLPITTKAIIMRDTSDINTVIQNLYEFYEQQAEQSYNFPFRLNKLDIHIAKVNALTGSSYIELPDFIKNKKAIINIKNEDQKCFIYSVLCALKTPANHPERVSNYKDRMKELKYKDEDMPMDINKIMYFEKRNNLRINVYGIGENKSKSIIPLYVSKNRDMTEYPLIPL